MIQVNPNLTFNGNCEEAFNFYRSVFGGEFNQVMRFKDMPPTSEMEIPESAKEKIMHMSLDINKEIILMGNDANPAFGNVTIGQNISLSVMPKSKDEADKIFKKLSEGGKITMPMADMFWNAYFGMLIDKFNIYWMINFDYPKKD